MTQERATKPQEHLCGREAAYQALGSSGRRKERARARETSEGCHVSPSRTPVFSRAHYFQAPATQAMWEAS